MEEGGKDAERGKIDGRRRGRRKGVKMEEGGREEESKDMRSWKGEGKKKQGRSKRARMGERGRENGETGHKNGGREEERMEGN